MDKQAIKDYILYHCPDIPMLKKRITKAKLDSLDRHRMLDAEIREAEADFSAKERLVKKYMDRFPKYAAAAEPMMEQMLAQAPAYQNRGDLDRIRTDMRFCRFAYGFAMDEYVFFGLETKSLEERKSFVSNEERIYAAYRMNDFSDMRILNDKWTTYKLLKPYFKRDAILISNRGDFHKYTQFVKKHPVYVKKRLNMNCGQGIELVDTRNSAESVKQQFDSLLKERNLILEECIVQSKQMALFNESSVNTIRCVTMNTKNGIEIFPHSFMKNGRSGSFVDNGGAGGILIGIDDATGIVDTDGMDELGRIYPQHPDSGTVYQGYQIPEWETMLAISKEVAAHFPRMKYCSWDLAHTEKGWVIVEGNMAGQMVAQQMTINRGIKNDLEGFMNNMDLLA